MRRIAVLIIGGALTVGAAACGSSTTGQSATHGTSGTAVTTTTASGSTSTASSAASASLTSALNQADEMERGAVATYQGIIGVLGNVRPFSNVAASEQQHVDTVRQLAQQHGITLTEGTVSVPSAPSTKTAACQAGVALEQQLIASYSTLIGELQTYPNVTKVLTTLQAAARDDHLPAMEHCA